MKILKSFFYNLIPFKIKNFIYFRFHNALNNVNYKNRIVKIVIENISFKLCLEDGNYASGREYSRTTGDGYIYEETMILCLQKILEKTPNFTFMDIGSYIGYYASYVAKLSGPNAKIIAIESNEEYASLNERSNALNNFSNVSIHNRVVSNISEKMIVFQSTTINEKTAREKLALSINMSEKFLLGRLLTSPNYKQSVTLDQLCQESNYKPDVIKIDVHGAEGKVLFGAKDNVLSKAKYVLLELHPDSHLSKYSDSITKKDIFNIFHEKNFKTYMVSPFRYTTRDIDYLKFKHTKKLNYIEITKNNIAEIFFDRKTDVFILAIHNNYNIKDINCFEQSN